ncbi:hypothetical protein E1263_20750 [Kribbella antibiotica]|uniref:Glycosyltransferase RgtA/B/C/D-like domain-containing protein n=1 Tax=Kribbella antibiotica TaxID=190195 RepID=A0A4R4ZKG3_9ACTN|nr:hypothetical protein [Kribbella antibiotica]TDD58079.1 hypothetical protein E1263_20750 [Kribbella antibiotica]
MRRALPWLLPLLVAAVGLHTLDVLRYGVYFALAIALPGTLLLRAVWRSVGNWAEDLGLGAIVGAAWMLVGWALFTAVGWQRWLVVWPLLTLAAFALPRLRSCWRIAQPSLLPLRWTWGLAIASALMLAATIRGVMGYHVPPPDATSYYQDLLYHLSMVSELTRAVPPELPQVVGERLEYHWFANADMAAAVDITRLNPIVVLFRLWVLPWLVVALLVCATLARTVSRTWWTGVLAAAALTAPQLYLLVDTSINLNPPVSFLSPSQTFGLVACVAAGIFLIELLFRDGPRSLWLLVVAMAVVGGGSKPTVLPVLVGAVGLAALYKRLQLKLVVAGALLVAVGAITLLTVAGSTSGSQIQFLAILKTSPGYERLTGDTTPAGVGGLLVPSLVHGAVLGTAVMVLSVLLIQSASLAGFFVVRRDPVAWFLVGAMVVGWLGYLFIDHPGVSESYFLYTATPFSIAAAGWVAATASRRLAVVVLVLLALAPVKSFIQNAIAGDTEAGPVFRSAQQWVYPDEQSSAAWLAANSAPTDVVATNTWCRPVDAKAPGCDARGYLVSGLAGRRTVIEGWAYTNEAMAAQGVGGRRYTEQPSPWPDRVALVTQTFASPTPALLKRLHDQYGVRWLYADARAGTVSPKLAELVPLRHSNGKVAIYDLGG